MTQNYPWAQEFPGAITICDTHGIILEMNDKAVEIFSTDGGIKLIGSNVFDCHPEPACNKLMALYKTQEANIYTIEKNGIKKLIYQTPWYQNGQFAGFIELAIEIPFDMPHYKRD